MMRKISIREVRLLLALTLLSVLLHGYHVGIEDQAIYLPAIKKQLDPGLYPHDAFFFEAQTKLTLFDEAVAELVKLTRLPLEWVLLLGYLAVTYLLLKACLEVARRLFAAPEAQWGAVTMIVMLLPLQASFTKVEMLDRYLHPRGPATVALLFALVAVIDRKPRALAWLVVAGIFHPQMAAVGAIHLFVLGWLMWRDGRWRRAAPAGLPTMQLGGVNPAWEVVTGTRTHHYPLQWPWYGWLGVFVPLMSLYALSRSARQAGAETRERVCCSFFLSGWLGVALAVAVSVTPGLERLVAVQFMRVLHLVYFLFFLGVGGWVTQRFLEQRMWRWVVFFGMVTAPAVMGYGWYYRASPHIEWPGSEVRNQWVQAFDWIKQNTPRDALFALDPHYFEREGEGHYGFRAVAERSMLADYSKDRAVAGLMPAIAPRWLEQVQDAEGFRRFRREDFLRLRRKYGVSWAVIEGVAPVGIECPYENGRVKVCRVD